MKHLPRKNPFAIDFFSDDFFKPLFNFSRELTAMKTDITENEKGYKLEIDMPGVSKENISLELEDGYLTVFAKSENVTEEKNKEGTLLRKERYSGTCSRSYFVGDAAQSDIEANYKDGVLQITFPKEPPKLPGSKKIIEIK